MLERIVEKKETTLDNKITVEIGTGMSPVIMTSEERNNLKITIKNILGLIFVKKSLKDLKNS
ncbi:MAG: hypothetical protein WC745_01315 [Patescibacteria group bacterium]|jgi:hypothetical protein